MKVALLAVLFTAPLTAWCTPASTACSATPVSFNINLDDSRHELAQPEPGKARIYFIQNLGPHNYIGVIQVALDGAWVGANRNDSWFSVSLEPGKHQVCVNVKSRWSTYGKLVELADLNAEPGQVYYFRVRLNNGQNEPQLDLQRIDDSEGQRLVATYPFSDAKMKK
jgi:hypothetical protein